MKLVESQLLASLAAANARSDASALRAQRLSAALETATTKLSATATAYAGGGSSAGGGGAGVVDAASLASEVAQLQAQLLARSQEAFELQDQLMQAKQVGSGICKRRGKRGCRFSCGVCILSVVTVFLLLMVLVVVLPMALHPSPAGNGCIPLLLAAVQLASARELESTTLQAQLSEHSQASTAQQASDAAALAAQRAALTAAAAAEEARLLREIQVCVHGVCVSTCATACLRPCIVLTASISHSQKNTGPCALPPTLPLLVLSCTGVAPVAAAAELCLICCPGCSA